MPAAAQDTVHTALTKKRQGVMHGQAQGAAYDLVEVVEGGILWVMHNLRFPRQEANTWEVDEPAGPISK